MSIPQVGNTGSYFRTEVEGDLYVETRVEEEVRAVVQITQPMGNAVVTHTGSYGKIKFVLDGKEYVAPNPIKESFGQIIDSRINTEGKKIIAERRNANWKLIEAIDMIGVKFNLSNSAMASLHNKLYMHKKSINYFIEIPKDYEQENV